MSDVAVKSEHPGSDPSISQAPKYLTKRSHTPVFPIYLFDLHWCRLSRSGCQTRGGPRSSCSGWGCLSCQSRWWRWSPASPQPPGSSPGSSSWPCAWPSGTGSPGRREGSSCHQGVVTQSCNHFIFPLRGIPDLSLQTSTGCAGR